MNERKSRWSKIRARRLAAKVILTVIHTKVFTPTEVLLSQLKLRMGAGGRQVGREREVDLIHFIVGPRPAPAKRWSTEPRDVPIREPGLFVTPIAAYLALVFMAIDCISAMASRA
jgi:hypothetical protein